jgi:hypothetical protein
MGVEMSPAGTATAMNWRAIGCYVQECGGGRQRQFYGMATSKWMASESTVRKLTPCGNRRVKYTSTTSLNANWSHKRLDS